MHEALKLPTNFNGTKQFFHLVKNLTDVERKTCGDLSPEQKRRFVLFFGKSVRGCMRDGHNVVCTIERELFKVFSSSISFHAVLCVPFEAAPVLSLGDVYAAVPSKELQSALERKTSLRHLQNNRKKSLWRGPLSSTVYDTS
jgi:hypothetical protein